MVGTFSFNSDQFLKSIFSYMDFLHGQRCECVTLLPALSSIVQCEFSCLFVCFLILASFGILQRYKGFQGKRNACQILPVVHFSLYKNCHHYKTKLTVQPVRKMKCSLSFTYVAIALIYSFIELTMLCFERAGSRFVGWCFKPSQPQRIISGLKETFIKRYIVERTSKAEIRPGEQSEKAESCRGIYGMKYGLKGHKDRNRHKNRIKRNGQARLECTNSKK